MMPSLPSNFPKLVSFNPVKINQHVTVGQVFILQWGPATVLQLIHHWSTISKSHNYRSMVAEKFMVLQYTSVGLYLQTIPGQFELDVSDVRTLNIVKVIIPNNKLAMLFKLKWVVN